MDDLVVDEPCRVVGVVAGTFQFQGVSTGVVLERLPELASVFERLARRETQVNAVVDRYFPARFHVADVLDLVIIEPVGLRIGKAPKGVTVVRFALASSPVSADRRIEVAHGFAGMPQHHVHLRLVGRALQADLVKLDRLVETAEARQGARLREPPGELVRLEAVQDLRLLERLQEFALAIEDPDVVASSTQVVRCQFDAALQQKLRIVVHTQPQADLGQQAHCLDVVLVYAEEVPAELFGLVQLVLVEQVDDAAQLRWQALEVFQLR